MFTLNHSKNICTLKTNSFHLMQTHYNTPVSLYHLNESETRYNLIDPSIAKAKWNLHDDTQIWFEVPVQGYDASPQSGITDYCMFRTNGEVLAVIEAKKTRRDARVGKEQVFQYVTEIEKKQSFRPFAFMANGEDLFFWDTEEYPERLIAGFFTRDAFILEYNYNAGQTRFLRTVQTVFMQKRKIEEADLYDAPFSNFGANAIEKLFNENEVHEIIELVKRLAA